LHHKTKLCHFHLVGACVKKEGCNFAHGFPELRPLPDLRNTKFCTQLASEGECQDPLCTFAHHRRELRRLAKDEAAITLASVLAACPPSAAAAVAATAATATRAGGGGAAAASEAFGASA